MRTSVKYYPDNVWQIGESFFNEEWLGKYESILAQGNGYMGTRSATEESYLEETRNTFVAGSFNKFDEYEVSELPNLPDLWNLNLRLNGERFDLTQGEIEAYERSLCLKNGELRRNIIWKNKQGDRFKLDFRRFVSMDNLHLMVQELEIQALKKDSEIEILSAIDGQVTNSGSQHFHEGQKRLYDGEIMQMTSQTSDSKIDFVFHSMHQFTKDEVAFQPKSRVEMERRKIQMRYWLELKQNERLRIVKKASIYSNRDKHLEDLDLEDLKEYALDKMRGLKDFGYNQLISASEKAWNEKVWDQVAIEIESEDFMDHLAINFARYHLHVMTPAHDSRMNIGAKGLSGEGYKGHTFWDTEIFMLPYYIYSYPEIARSLLEYRYHGLDGARRKAKDNGYEGAQYPWEAAWIEDGETTPLWGDADVITGKESKIWTGIIEQHITSDIAYGIYQYFQATQDHDFMEEMGFEMIFETAKFWNSRLEWSEEEESYHINNVIGPDEYKEHVNNNAYTNFTAKWNMQLAMDVHAYLLEEKPDLLSALDQKIDVEKLVKSLPEKIQKIYIPEANEAGIIPQDDTYLSKKIVDLSKFKDHELVGTIFHHYNFDQINEIQVTKQADVLLLIFLFEHLFDQDIKRKNWDYYEEKTLHDSSLSLSTHSALAADLGEIDMAYDFFKDAIDIDMGPVMKSSDAGIHAASLGGIWQMVIFGFGGVRALDGKLRIDPHLPKAWKNLSFDFRWHQDRLKIDVSQTSLSIENLSQNHELIFTCRGKEYRVKDQLTISL